VKNAPRACLECYEKRKGAASHLVSMNSYARGVVLANSCLRANVQIVPTCKETLPWNGLSRF